MNYEITLAQLERIRLKILFLGKASRRHNENADDAERGRRRGYKRSHARRLEFQTEELKEAASNAQSQEDEEIRCSFESMQFEDAPEEFPTADENDENDDFRLRPGRRQ